MIIMNITMEYEMMMINLFVCEILITLGNNAIFFGKFMMNKQYSKVLTKFKHNLIDRIDISSFKLNLIIIIIFRFELRCENNQ